MKYVQANTHDCKGRCLADLPCVCMGYFNTLIASHCFGFVKTCLLRLTVFAHRL